MPYSSASIIGSCSELVKLACNCILLAVVQAAVANYVLDLVQIVVIYLCVCAWCFWSKPHSAVWVFVGLEFLFLINVLLETNIPNCFGKKTN